MASEVSTHEPILRQNIMERGQGRAEALTLWQLENIEMESLHSLASFFFPFLFFVGLEPIGRCCPHSGQVFSQWLIVSGNTITDTPRDVLY
jgi:hypothetical protein